jgi:glycerophosphoryl diester phosphodiesterase
MQRLFWILFFTGESVMSKSAFLKKVGKSFLRTAHRGASAFAPENTIEAFEMAVDLGVDMIELDIRLTRDQVPVILHESDLALISNVLEVFPDRESYKVDTFTLEEIRHIGGLGEVFLQHLQKEREASRTHKALQKIREDEFREFLSPQRLAEIQKTSYSFPTLEELLKWRRERHPELLLNLELKNAPYSSVPALLPYLEGEDWSKLLFSSFNHQALLDVKKAFPLLSVAPLIYAHFIQMSAYTFEVLKGEAIHYCVEFMEDPEVLKQELQQAEAFELGVHLWTVDSPRLMKYFIEQGVHSLITNFPNRLNAVLREG